MIYAKKRKLENPEHTKERKKSLTQQRECVRLTGHDTWSHLTLVN